MTSSILITDNLPIDLALSGKIVYFKTMRVVAEIAHPDCKITIFHWNNRYLIKLEAGLLEQTFKVSEFDITSEEDIKKILNEEFISKAMERFQDMYSSLKASMEIL